MKLTDDELRRGVNSWSIDGPAVARVRVAKDDGSPGDWSAPLTDPRGSLAPSPLLPGGEVAVVPDDRHVLELPFWVRCHALVGEEDVTAVWSAVDDPPTVFRDIPGFGNFHRRIIATPYLVWPEEPATIWEDGTTLRFERVPEEGQVVTAAGEPEPGSLSSSLTTVAMTIPRGQITILADGATVEGAVVQVSALLGYLALCVGDDAVGPIVHREDYEASPEEIRYTIHSMGPVTTDNMIRPMFSVDPSVLDLIAAHLPTVLGAGRSSRRTDALRVALSAFERAVRSRNVLERFLAYFVGTEAIVSAYADDCGLRGQ